MKSDKFNVYRTIEINNLQYGYYSLKTLAENTGCNIERLPFSLRILLENLLRHYDNVSVTDEHIEYFINWDGSVDEGSDISYYPARVLMQDLTGVPAIVDLAAMRDAVHIAGGDVSAVNPCIKVDLVIDHSVVVDSFGNKNAFAFNVAGEMKRNQQRYKFLKWGKDSFANFRVVPPGSGICHQVNLEYLADVVSAQPSSTGKDILIPDTLVGTDSHTTMINALSVLGWGVGGIEAEAAMLGQPVSMLIPEVIGFRLIGRLPEGCTATDLVLTITNILRQKGVVGKFVEFYGPGLKYITLADRATVANMAPEYGATCGFFPIDDATIDYLKLTGRSEEAILLVEAYAREQGLRYSDDADIVYSDIVELDMRDVKPSLAGPKRPQDKIDLSDLYYSFKASFNIKDDALHNKNELSDGSIVIAAITSCTNTSNPAVMIAAGLLARNALKKGLRVKPWVKTSLAPGSKVVTGYLQSLSLDRDLDALGFNLVGYGCTTCIGNSGPLSTEVSDAISSKNLTVASILSGNRNFEGRIHPLVKANYLASPPLVVAYALFGSVNIDILNEELGKDDDGQPVYLRDIWPSDDEVQSIIRTGITTDMFKEKYDSLFEGDESWVNIESGKGELYEWHDANYYIQKPPYFNHFDKAKFHINSVKDAAILAIFGDSITTDHISPAGTIAQQSPAAKYLDSCNIPVAEYNSYGTRRGNHNVMIRGTFANIRIKNRMLQDDNIEGGYTRCALNDDVMSIYDAAVLYKEAGRRTVIFAGKEYGTGSSRDWAAKGTALLGVAAVIALSFERIHRSNLIGMGVVPLLLPADFQYDKIRLHGNESVSIEGLECIENPNEKVQCIVKNKDSDEVRFMLTLAVYTKTELEYLMRGGILNKVLCDLLN